VAVAGEEAIMGCTTQVSEESEVMYRWECVIMRVGPRRCVEEVERLASP